MRRLLSVLIFALVGTAGLRADDAAPVTDPVLVAAHYRQVLNHPQFQETEETPLKSRFSEWMSEWFRRLGSEFGDFKYASRMPAFESLLMTVLVVGCVAGLLYIAARLTRRHQQLDFQSENDAGNPKAFRPPESYDAEIDAAIRAGDWHTAWLASWRQFLSRLEHRQLVEADRTRTNREYLAQLRDKSLPAPTVNLLTGMVDAYDRFIYGRKAIGEPDWSLFHRQIGEAVLLLHLDAWRGVEPVSEDAP